jgi:hypothetical protein
MHFIWSIVNNNTEHLKNTKETRYHSKIEDFSLVVRVDYTLERLVVCKNPTLKQLFKDKKNIWCSIDFRIKHKQLYIYLIRSLRLLKSLSFPRHICVLRNPTYFPIMKSPFIMIINIHILTLKFGIFYACLNLNLKIFN